MDIASAIFNFERAKTRKNITLMSLNYSYAWWCIACHGLKYHNESKRLDSNIHFPFFCHIIDEGRFCMVLCTRIFNVKLGAGIQTGKYCLKVTTTYGLVGT